jgi:hypothetical protein
LGVRRRRKPQPKQGKEGGFHVSKVRRGTAV